MTQGIGIHIEQDSFTLACISCNQGKISLDALIHTHYKDKDSLQESLEKLFHDHAWDPYTVAVSVSSIHCIIRKFELPFIDKLHIGQTVRYETERYIPSTPIESLVIDYQILSQSDGHSKIMAVAIPKRTVEEWIETLEMCGIYPYALEMDILGMVHTARQSKILGTAKDIVLLDVHPAGFGLAVYNEGECTLLRSVRLHIQSLMDGMMSDMDDTMELSLAPNEETHYKPFSKAEEQKFYDRLFRELQRTILNIQGISQILISGRAELIQNLPAYLQEKLNLPVSLWDVCGSFDVNKTIPASLLFSTPIPIGLALKACGQDDYGMNFRKDFPYAKAFDILRIPLACTLTLVFIFLLVLSLYTVRLGSQSCQKYERMMAKAQEIGLQFDPQFSLDSINYWNRIYEVHSKIQQSLEDATPKLPSIQDSLHAWGAILRQLVIVRQSFPFTIDSIKIDQHEAVFSGRMETDLVLDAMKRALREISLVDKSSDSIRVLSVGMVEDAGKTGLKRRYTYQVRWTSEK